MNDAPRYAYRAALAAAALMLIGGALVCLSWIAGVPEVTRVLPASSLAQFNTGLLFALGGGGLVAGLRARRWIVAGCAIAVVVLAAATLTQYLWDVDLGIDQWLVAGTPGSATPGRMAPNTAVTFVLGGFAMLFLAAVASLPWLAGIVQMLGALVAAVGAIALVGYTADIAAAFQWAGLTRMAFFTAAEFVAFGAALMFAALCASGARTWHEMPWLAATSGVGVAALAGLGWYALRNAPPGAQRSLVDIGLAFGLLTAVLVAGLVAQARHLRRQAALLGQANAALQASGSQLQLLLDNVQTAVIVHGPDSAIRYANPTAAAILGLTPDQLLGRTSMDPLWHFVREDGSPMPVAEYPVSVVFARKAALRDYMAGVRTAPGRKARWVLVNAVPDLAPDGSVRLVIVSFVDISERQQQTQQLERIALTDALTGLASRRHFLSEAEREISRARRGHPLSLLMFDVDRFKAINDEHGHAVGDRALVALGGVARAVLRDSDMAGRIGGEEFAVLLPDADESLALAVAERLRAAVADVAVPLDSGGALRFTISAGAATLAPEDADAAGLLARADAAMYEAKRAGRNCVRRSAPTVRPRAAIPG